MILEAHELQEQGTSSHCSDWLQMLHRAINQAAVNILIQNLCQNHKAE